MRVGISTRIKLEILNSKTGAARKGPGPFPNMILNGGLDRMNSRGQGNIFRYCRVGTGTLEPSAEQTGLTNPVGGFASGDTGTASSSGESPWWHQLTRTYQFQPAADEETAGLPISEIEFRESANDSSTCWARALIRDSQGNPTTIVLLEDEILRVVYSVRNNVPTGDATGVVEINGEDYNYVARVALADASTAWGVNTFDWRPLVPDRIAARESQVLGGETGNITDGGEMSLRTSSYVSGSFERGVGAEAGPTSNVYANGIGTLQLLRTYSSSSTRVMVQCSVSRVSDGSGIPKTADDILVLNDFFTFSWGRA